MDPKKPAAGIVKEIAEQKFPLCPHCHKELEAVDWMTYANGMFKVVSCSNCKVVIGITN